MGRADVNVMHCTSRWFMRVRDGETVALSFDHRRTLDEFMEVMDECDELEGQSEFLLTVFRGRMAVVGSMNPRYVSFSRQPQGAAQLPSRAA